MRHHILTIMLLLCVSLQGVAIESPWSVVSSAMCPSEAIDNNDADDCCEPAPADPCHHDCKHCSESISYNAISSLDSSVSIPKVTSLPASIDEHFYRLHATQDNPPPRSFF
ncbi:hypothetical protein [Paraferrimonas haliotis]|uniref:Secreted protein n=1 Tax=Paraferrimonas haliotis TaxID=2013866 RepID=A0AA37WX73_9GAMM|nr:hypothetical protein [Paraferrimonas haliotis]GLS84017.1 hypothetical protein GCM10007894_19940 [Paraferrimonas haliotis]